MGDGSAHENLSFDEPDPGQAFLQSVGACRVAAGLDAKAVRSLAYLLARAKWFEKAIALAKKAVELDPMDVENHRLLATTLGDFLGSEDEAIKACRAGLEWHPEDLELRLVLVEALNSAGLVQDTLVEAREAVTQHPDDPRAHAMLARALAVCSYRSEIGAQLVDESLAEWRTVLQIDPEFPDAHRQIAGVLEEMGRNEEAAVFHQQACQLWEHQTTPGENAATQTAAIDLLENIFDDMDSALSLDDLLEAFTVWQFQPAPPQHTAGLGEY